MVAHTLRCERGFVDFSDWILNLLVEKPKHRKEQLLIYCPHCIITLYGLYDIWYTNDTTSYPTCSINNTNNQSTLRTKYLMNTINLDSSAWFKESIFHWLFQWSSLPLWESEKSIKYIKDYHNATEIHLNGYGIPFDGEITFNLNEFNEFSYFLTPYQSSTPTRKSSIVSVWNYFKLIGIKCFHGLQAHGQIQFHCQSRLLQAYYNSTFLQINYAIQTILQSF